MCSTGLALSYRQKMLDGFPLVFLDQLPEEMAGGASKSFYTSVDYRSSAIVAHFCHQALHPRELMTEAVLAAHW